jgi:superfamily I DNA and/or RNA helicase
VVWRGGHRLLLVLHDEVESQQSNPVEAAIIKAILSAEDDLAHDSVAVVTPHRAQRALLTLTLKDWFGGPVGLIDTVERLQGGERPTILFSGTVSDPVVIAQTAEFILNINRSNVAFSRTQERLVVVCARSLLDHIPTEVEHYESALLWKHLRSLCRHEVASVKIEGATVSIRAPQSLHSAINQ